MPELPEVESIRRYLRNEGVEGRKIRRAEIEWPRCVIEPESDPEALLGKIVDRPIGTLGRRGKYLLFPLRPPTDIVRRLGDAHLVLHMGMTGSLHVRKPRDPVLRFARTTFWLDDDRRIELVDPRKWARLWAVANLADAIGGLGPEPQGISSEDFASRIARRRSRVKSVLLDQSLIAGVGNIYADEALHLAGVSPLRRSNRISRPRLEALHSAIIETLDHATDFIGKHPSPDGSPYVVDAYDERMKLPRMDGGKCPTCCAPMRSRRIDGRTAYYCGSCQR